MLGSVNHFSADCGQIGVDTCFCSFAMNICKPVFEMPLVSMCLPALAVSLVRFLRLLGEATEALLSCREMDLEFCVFLSMLMQNAYAKCLCAM